MSRKRSRRSYRPQIFLCIAIVVLGLAIGAILMFRDLFQKPELPNPPDQSQAPSESVSPPDDSTSSTDTPVEPELDEFLASAQEAGKHITGSARADFLCNSYNL